MRLPEDQVEGFGMAHDDVAHRFDCVLEAFAAIDEAERRDDGAIVQTERTLRHVRLAEGDVGHAVRDHADLIRIDAVARDEDLTAGGGEHDDGRRARADRAGDAQMRIRRLR